MSCKGRKCARVHVRVRVRVRVPTRQGKGREYEYMHHDVVHRCRQHVCDGMQDGEARTSGAMGLRLLEFYTF